MKHTIIRNSGAKREVDEFNEHLIPNRIRQIRKSMDLTLEELAEKIKMTKAYVSKLERSKKAPPISTLFKIARALKVDLNYLITGVMNSTNSKISFVPKEEQISVINRRTGYGYVYYALAYRKSNKTMEPFLITVPDIPEPVPFSHNGEEFNYLIKGKARFFIGGTFYDMKEGDSIYFDSSLPHYAVATEGKEAVFLMVNTAKE